MPAGHVQGKFFRESSERPEKISVVLYIIKGEQRYSAITQEERELYNEHERDRNPLCRRDQYHAKMAIMVLTCILLLEQSFQGSGYCSIRQGSREYLQATCQVMTAMEDMRHFSKIHWRSK